MMVTMRIAAFKTAKNGCSRIHFGMVSDLSFTKTDQF